MAGRSYPFWLWTPNKRAKTRRWGDAPVHAHHFGETTTPLSNLSAQDNSAERHSHASTLSFSSYPTRTRPLNLLHHILEHGKHSLLLARILRYPRTVDYSSSPCIELKIAPTTRGRPWLAPHRRPAAKLPLPTLRLGRRLELPRHPPRRPRRHTLRKRCVAATPRHPARVSYRSSHCHIPDAVMAP